MHGCVTVPRQISREDRFVMFQQLREKLSDKLWSLGSDEQDKSISDLVTRGTSESLIAPEWSINMALVDMVNQNPTVVPEKLLRVLKRAMLKPNAKAQVLGLTILETCIKNCDPALYAALATSELWLELVKMTADTTITRVDVEVRDKILCMVEDYAKVLPQKEFREAYEYLLEAGVDFPVRSPDEQPPILTPPPVYQPPALVPPGAPAPAAGAAAAAAAAAAGHRPAAEDPLAGVSEEDRAAIRAAMREMEEEERVVRESVALAASTALFQQMDQQQHAGGRDGHAASQQQQQQQQQQGADAGPTLPADPQAAMEATSNATALLNEMLASETDPREPFVVELAEQCVRFRSTLEDAINALSDETQLASALVHYEALQAAISKYDELLSKAQQAAGAQPQQQQQQQQPVDAQVQSLMVEAAAAAAAAAAGPAAGSAGPNFSLLGDEEEDSKEEQLLSSKRAPTAAPAPSPAAPAPATPAPGLIDLLDAPLPAADAERPLELLSEPAAPAAHAPPPAPQAGAGAGP